MKKKYLSISIIFVLILMVFAPISVFAKAITLKDIADTFNNSNTVKDYAKLLNVDISASYVDEKPNILSISITKNSKTSTVNYELSGSILSNEKLTDDNFITAYFIADCIGQLYGDEDGALINNFTMFDEETSNYTVGNEGFELTENGNYYSTKIDINKKVPLIDESNFYLKEDEFDIIKEIIDDETVGNQTGKTGKLAYNLVVREDKNSIYIAEKDKLTKSSYKSILSALKVMYGDKMVKYFKSVYPKFFDGIGEYDGVTIETNVDIDTSEQPMFTGMKVVLVTLDNEYIKDEITRTEYVGETIKYGDKTLNIDFSKNQSFELGFFEEVDLDSDIAFLYKYILEPVFEDSAVEVEDDTVYFNVENGKIVVGDKDNSIFKVIMTDDSLVIEPTTPNATKTTLTAKHKNAKVIEYEEGKGEDHFRYGSYNVKVNVTYGTETNPSTGDNIKTYFVLFTTSLLGLGIIANKKRNLVK